MAFRTIHYSATFMVKPTYANYVTGITRFYDNAIKSNIFMFLIQISVSLHVLTKSSRLLALLRIIKPNKSTKSTKHSK